MANWIKSVLYDISAAFNALKPWRSSAEVVRRSRQPSKVSARKRAAAMLDLTRYPFERKGQTCTGRGVRCSLANGEWRRSTRSSRQWLLPQSGRIVRNSSARLFRTSNKVNRKEEPWMMTDEEVMEIIREKERACKVQCGIVDRFESNKLSSNHPVEDRSFVARLPYDNDAIVFGVLDGHGGDACAHGVSQRLADYIAMALLPEDVLMATVPETPLRAEHLLLVNNPNQYNYRKDIKCSQSLMNFYSDLRKPENRSLGQSAAYSGFWDEFFSHSLKKAFLTLDRDISQEALLDSSGAVEKRYFDAAVSGACAVIAYLNGTELYVANAGDCRAVMGVENEDGTLSAVPLSDDHTSGERWVFVFICLLNFGGGGGVVNYSISPMKLPILCENDSDNNDDDNGIVELTVL